MKKTDHCQYDILENGVHHFVWLTDKRQAVDDYFEIATPIILDAVPKGQIRFLIEFMSDNLPPLKYMTRRAKNFYAEHPHVPEQFYIAFLHNSYEINMAEAMLEGIRNSTTRRFFNRSEREQALQWLVTKK